MEFIDASDSSHTPTYCSFVATGETLAYQAIYQCGTCDDLSLCCCAGCAEVCHAGHDVQFLAFGKAYCDCGSANCNLYADSRTKLNLSRNLLDNSCKENANYTSQILEFDLPSSTLLAIGQQCCEVVQETKETFWFGATSSPRCCLEQLAQIIFQHHTAGIEYDPVLSGAEWWVQVKDSSSVIPSIDLHYDKDEYLAEMFNIGVFPYISTVSYIAGDAAMSPTLILPNVASTPIGMPLPSVFLSYPSLGKHITFDGRYLHGAPAHPALRQITSPSKQTSKRITFLVNIWINHHPHKVQPLPDATIACLSAADLPINTNLSPHETSITKHSLSSIVIENSSEAAYERVVLPYVSADSAWGVGDEEAELVVSMWLPQLQAGSDCIQIEYEDEEACARLEYIEDELEEDGEIDDGDADREQTEENEDV